jgi:hypothetical protein
MSPSTRITFLATPIWREKVASNKFTMSFSKKSVSKQIVSAFLPFMLIGKQFIKTKSSKEAPEDRLENNAL